MVRVKFVALAFFVGFPTVAMFFSAEWLKWPWLVWAVLGLGGWAFAMYQGWRDSRSGAKSGTGFDRL